MFHSITTSFSCFHRTHPQGMHASDEFKLYRVAEARRLGASPGEAFLAMAGEDDRTQSDTDEEIIVEEQPAVAPQPVTAAAAAVVPPPRKRKTPALDTEDVQPSSSSSSSSSQKKRRKKVSVKEVNARKKANTKRAEQKRIADHYVEKGIDIKIIKDALQTSSIDDQKKQLTFFSCRKAQIDVYGNIPWACYEPASGMYGQRGPNEAVIKRITKSYMDSGGAVIVSDTTHPKLV